MMQPKKTKFRKAHKGRIHGVASSGATLSFGQFGLKAMAPDRVTARQIEAARRALFKVVEEHLRGHMRDAVRVSQARGHRRGHHAVPEPETSDVYRGQQVLVF